MLKRTPLFEAHRELGGKLIEFGGWEMPVQYSSIMDEHNAVRTAAGIFDISHMGEVNVQGTTAADFLNLLLTNDVRKLQVGQGQYTLMCNDRGGAIDDLYLYRIGPEEFLLIINASRIEADLAWIGKVQGDFASRDALKIVNRSDDLAAVAIQGPMAVRIINDVFPGKSSGGCAVAKASDLKKNEIGRFSDGTRHAWVSRTGYTGEDGFEVVASANAIVPIWNAMIERGRPYGLKPAGLGARDTLRTEVCYPLYGHELDEETGPVEAGLGFFVAWDKQDFIGRAALAEKKSKGTAKKLVAFKTVEKCAPPRPGYTLWEELTGGQQLGTVVSGTLSPTLATGIGMAYVAPQTVAAGSIMYIETRGRRAAVTVCRKPLYRKPVDPAATP